MGKTKIFPAWVIQLTFSNEIDLWRVIQSFAIINDSINREKNSGLDLTKSIQDACGSKIGRGRTLSLEMSGFVAR